MNKFDYINSIFELGGAIVLTLNVYALWKERKLVGVRILPTIWYQFWGAWNLIYYYGIGHKLSWAAGLAVFLVNSAWVSLALLFSFNNYNKRKNVNNELNKQCESINEMVKECYGRSYKAGWYHNPVTKEPLERNVPEMLCLVHSEVSEALEGFRKNLNDDHLPSRPMIEVELADAMIRIMDLAGHLKLDLGGAYKEKLEYNATRKDHSLEARAKEGGKAF